MLYIHTSNQLEVLKNQYASVVREPLKSVFKSETVVVQNAGMARWLSMEMANISGISANTEFLFPAEFMWRLLRFVSPDIPEHSQCAPDTLRFHIFDELLNRSANYPELHHYIHQINENRSVDYTNSDKHAHFVNKLNTWEISCQLSQLLDQYLFYRSDWVSDWEASDWDDTKHWQSRLWNRCVKDKGLLHWLALQEQFTHHIDTIDIDTFDERISFFSMSALSPSYVDLLGKVAEKIDIHIFIINPCEDIYWGDIHSPKRQAKLTVEQQDYADIGNPLLASLGTQGRDFITKLIDIPNAVPTLQSNDQTDYNHPDVENENNLLQCIQADINNLTTPSHYSHLNTLDNSILIHACHTAMREVEVLHDQLLHLLDSDTDLTPSDIVVMMPDIEQYAPYIETVFGSTITKSTQHSKTQQKLPFSIADRDPLNIFSMVQALDKLFALPESRFDVESVFELLEYEDIRIHFKLDDTHVAYCRELAKSTNIRWGISAKTRLLDDLPDSDEHTWKYALDRILLGYALSQHSIGESLFHSPKSLDLLAFSDIEGNSALIYSCFKKFVDTVFSINQWQTQTHSLNHWIVKTTQLIQQLSPENADQQQLFKSLADLELKASLAQFDQVLSFDVYQKMLQECLSNITANEKYLGYGITFCALVPMRSVPFKVVALLGMNDGEFPRQDKQLSFDLTKNAPRKGDRSRRDEDRYLFLESILAAREKLIISYIGQSIKDNTELPPSILVNELIDTLSISCGNDFSNTIIKHPIQAFSHRYFDSTDATDHNSPLFSYAKHFTHLDLSKDSGAPIPFITNPLEQLEDEYRQISLEELTHFFKNPAKVFLKQRFNIQTYNDNNELETREPFALESFKDQELRQLILNECNSDLYSDAEIKVKEITMHDTLLMARAKGLLPYGQIGDDIVHNEKRIVDTFLATIPKTNNTDDKHISVDIGDFNLSGTIRNLTEEGLLIIDFSTPYSGDYISLWLQHLLLNVSNSDNQAGTTTVFYSPTVNFQFNPVTNAKDHLETLLNYYWQGMHYPLLFFPKASFALFNHPIINNKTGENMGASETKWNGNEFINGEKFRFENWLLHRNQVLNKDQQPDDFLQISRDCLEPLFKHLDVIKSCNH